VARALALVDELRALLPQLGNGSSSELESVAQSLEAAIRPSNESADLSELRASMLAARDRPRDIDTVLDLSRRVDDVLALIDHQDQLEAAINGALTRLRAQER